LLVAWLSEQKPAARRQAQAAQSGAGANPPAVAQPEGLTEPSPALRAINSFENQLPTSQRCWAL